MNRDLRQWVNEGLIVLFFFVIGLEPKRELTTGSLAHPRAAAAPALAAVGGAVVAPAGRRDRRVSSRDSSHLGNTDRYRRSPS
ncbi:Na+/H+ antiporter NhaA [[Mycobacterium] nativiensis]|uniref:Na+/H+ antiporter NhaA n=1 Tax=[Mycobacterium] nativiensis TaxID=2855503 RepID=A0ABU5XSG5_9MYCO|nr:Na+/H+ antiporter NhaA [Mycolicibacter sp. MYC340]MEB3030653.1 Na+/H+ antiporter NhaA [Mycolicibacter sp. MYC340]